MAAEEREPVRSVEDVKRESRYLRGTIRASLADPLTAGVPEADRQLLKFHGTYLQDDRDLRDERRRQKLEPAYQFMVRVRAAGGVVTPAQWRTLDDLAHRYGDGSLRLTSRQSFQLHGVLKWHLKETIAEVHRTLLTTLAACGDVNRNVLCTSNPYLSPLHEEVFTWARRISDHLLPGTTAYHEIWLDQQKVLDSRGEEEPLYGPTYLPRKFKIALAIPPANDVDVFAHDLGLIAIEEGGRLAGFDVAVGGGMGMTYGEPRTYPQLAQVVGFCRPEQVVAVAEAVVAVQRDYGDRSDRRRARLKYTIDDRGLNWFREELEGRLGWRLAAARPYRFTHTGDRFGWQRGADGRMHLTLFVPQGRVRDEGAARWKSALKRWAEEDEGVFCLTPNQNLILAHVRPSQARGLRRLIQEYGLLKGDALPLRTQAMACVALPTCGLAMAEAERFLPSFLDKLQALFTEVGLAEAEATVRVSGCPNGCSRPYLAEIGLTGKAVGRYNLYLGAGATGERLNRLYRENATEEEILATLRPLLVRWAQERAPGERLGDFLVRTGVVPAVWRGQEFHP